MHSILWPGLRDVFSWVESWALIRARLFRLAWSGIALRVAHRVLHTRLCTVLRAPCDGREGQRDWCPTLPPASSFPIAASFGTWDFDKERVRDTPHPGMELD